MWQYIDAVRDLKPFRRAARWEITSLCYLASLHPMERCSKCTGLAYLHKAYGNRQVSKMNAKAFLHPEENKSMYFVDRLRCGALYKWFELIYESLHISRVSLILFLYSFMNQDQIAKNKCLLFQ